MHEIDNNTIFSVIKTLKEMDVRGYDSMNRLVGLVMLFESILNEPEKGQDDGISQENVC
jgi:hypothetical protein